MTLRAGWAAVAMPTRTDESLLGYDFRQERLAPGNDGEHDPLAARAVVLRAGVASAVLVTLDHCVVSVPLARELRARAATAAGVEPDQVIVACSHTHSAPMAFDPHLGADLTAALPHVDPAAGPEPERRVRQRLLDATGEAAARAGGLLVPVVATAAEAACGLAYRRRVPAPSGVRLNWNPEEYPELDVPPGADPTLTVLHLRRGDAVAGGAVVVGFGAHPVCLGKTSRVVSADWPGAALAAIAGFMPGTQPLFALGACGDTHPRIATQADAGALAPLGAAVAGLAVALARSARSSGEPALRTLARRVAIGRTELDLAAWRVDGCTVLAAPVELLQPLSARLRARVPGPLLLITNANGWTGYWPDAADLAAGGYEADAARAAGRASGDGERLIDALAGLAAEL